MGMVERTLNRVLRGLPVNVRTARLVDAYLAPLLPTSHPSETTEVVTQS
jgi:hypothetical protein